MRSASKVPPPPRAESADTEEAFLAGYDITQFERPSVAVDVVVLSVIRGQLKVVVYLRNEHPAKGKYALPGGFVQMAESLDSAAERLLRNKAGLQIPAKTKQQTREQAASQRHKGLFLEQLHTFGDVGRDPRGRIITVAYLALLPPKKLENAAIAPGAKLCTVTTNWHGTEGGKALIEADEGSVLHLAFDHALILGTAVKRLRETLDTTALAFALLPAELTLRALQDVHEAIRGETLNKDSFRRRMLASGKLLPTGKRQQDTSHRPAELYRYQHD
ncbi:MAG: NUDIX domain-containing protein [Polyangiaceae bacterium]|nr:NUDIX domain-containing protein [Polyangiaceae bacterium]